MTDSIQFDCDGPLATILLNRPAKRNALTHEMLLDLEDAGRVLRDMADVRAVIVRAEGEHFSVGMDISAMGSEGDKSHLGLRRQAELGGRMVRALQEIPQPTVCALQGVATGGGACIAAACDFRIASEGASMGYGEVRLGMNLMWNSVPACVALVGPARAKRLIMSGALVDVETLAEWGMIDEIVESGDLLGRATALADEYASLPPVAVQMIKRSINHVSGVLDGAAMHADVDQWILAVRSEDFSEGVAAFLEKRPGKFSGK